MSSELVHYSADLETSADRAWNLHNRVLRCVSAMNEMFLELGRALRTIHDERLYVALGYSTFEAYIASPEIALSRTLVYRLLRTVRIVDAGIIEPTTAQEIGVSKLDAIAPYIERAQSREEVQELVSDAKSLSFRDLNERLRERFGGDDAMEALRKEVEQWLRNAARQCRSSPDPVELFDALIQELMRFRERALWLQRTGTG